MDIKTYELTGRSADQLFTEIRYFIAESKATDQGLVRFNIKTVLPPEREERRQNEITRILKAAKKSSLIQLCVYSAELGTASTEAEYLKNKYPDLKLPNESENFFIVKI